MVDMSSPITSDSGRNFLRIFLLFIMAALTIAAIVTERWLRSVAAARNAVAKTSAAALPILGQVPSFEFTERSGNSFGAVQLKGKVWIADFIYTRCMGPCPTMSRHMAEMQKSLRDTPEICLVSFSADPEFDTPKVLREYAKRFEAGANQWFLLTGKFDALQKLAREGFKLGMEKNPKGQPSADDEPIIHSSHFILVDRVGRIRGYYDSSNRKTLEHLLGDARKLLKEKHL